MTAINPPVVNFSGGVIGGELHNRVDIQTYPSGCEISDNFRPTLQGVLMRRPPMIHVDAFTDHDLKGELFPFVFNVDASYLILATTDGFKFYANDGVIEIQTVSSTLAGSWTDKSTIPSSISVIGSDLWLDADGANYAIAEKAITVSGGDIAKPHILAFEIKHGPLDIKIGTASGDDDVLRYDRLRAGYHRLAFTPGATTVYLQFRHKANAGRYIANNVSILPGPDFSLPCPFLEDDFNTIHTRQIRDVLYMTHGDYWPRRLERRGDRSWSIVKFEPDDGPFGDINTTDITLSGSATSGEITLSSSEDLFTANDVGVVYQVTAGGVTVVAVANADKIYTKAIKVTGVEPTRYFTYEITGTFTGSVSLEYSSGNENAYSEVGSSLGFPKTAPASGQISDARPNETLYYRLGIRPGNYTSGTITMSLNYKFSSSDGKARILKITDARNAIAEVTSPLASTDTTTNWKRGDWNADDGFPVSVEAGFGRLWFARGARVWASKSDDYTSFESITDETDSSFSRNLATPSSDGVRWLAMLNHLIIGTSSLEQVGLGNTTSDPIGPANFQFLPGSEEGGGDIQPIVSNGSVLFVHRSKRRLMQFTQNPKALSETSYLSVDLTARAPEILNAKIVDIAVQREPERRIYVVLESGRVCELLFRREGELDIVAWSIVKTEGRVERVTILPRADEDIVYFIVRRLNAAGTWERSIERFGPERVLMDCDRYHLDASLGYELTKPLTTLEPSGTTGSITLTVDDTTFVVGDVGKIVWLNGGRATITAYTSGFVVTATVTSELDSADPCPALRWGMNAPASTLSGLDHLEGQTVSVWGDMTDLGTATVASGSVTLPQEVSVAYAGLEHTSRWKSLKLAYGAQKGTALGMHKAVKSIILLLYKCGGALTFGKGVGPGLRRSFTKMFPVPTRTAAVPYGEPVPLFSGEKDHAFDANYDPDARICIEVEGPSPAILTGFVPILDEKDR